MKLKKGDKVKILKGKDRGKTGTIIKVFMDENRVTVEGLNLFKKRARPRQQNQQGEIVELARPLSASNVALVCPSCGAATRVGYRIEGAKKVRYCKKCKSPA